MEEKSKCNHRRRRQRALKLKEKPKEVWEDSCEEELPLIRPPRPRKKNKDPLFQEDILDGFAFLSFKSYEDLERCVRAAEKLGSNILDPFPERVKESGRKKQSNFGKTSLKAAAGNRSSWEGGYECSGSESEGDRISDSAESDFFRASKYSGESRIGGEPTTAGTLGNLAGLPEVSRLNSPPISHLHLPQHYNNVPVENSSSLPSTTTPIITAASTPVVTTVSAQIPKISPLTDHKPYIDQKPPFVEQKPPTSHFIDQKPLLSTPLSVIDQKPPVFVDQKPLTFPEQKPNIFSPVNPSPQHNFHVQQLSRPYQPCVPATTVTTPCVATVTTATATTVSSNSISNVTTTGSNNAGFNTQVSKLQNGPVSTPNSRPSACLNKYSVSSLVGNSTPVISNNNNVSSYNINSVPVQVQSYAMSKSSSHLHSASLSSHPIPHHLNETPHSQNGTSHVPISSNSVITFSASSINGNVSTTLPSTISSPSERLKDQTSTQMSFSNSTASVPLEPTRKIKVEPVDNEIVSHVRSSAAGTLTTSSHCAAPYQTSSPQKPLYSHHSSSTTTSSCSMTSSSYHSSHSNISSSAHCAFPPHSLGSISSSLRPSPLIYSSNIKVEPGVSSSRITPPTTPRTTTPSHPPFPTPPSRNSPAARHSPARHSPRIQESHSLYGFSSGSTSLSTASHSFTKPWSSPISSSHPSSSANRIPSLSRPVIPPPTFPLPTPPVSAPLPPSAMFGTSLAPPSSLTNPSLLPPANPLVQDPLGVQADLLRRELDSRFLATQDRTLGYGSIGAVPTLLRTDVHHHQHQHTHVHQHLLPHMPPPPPPPIAPPAPSGIFSHSAAAPSLFKEVSKVTMDNSVYRPGGSLGSSYPPGLSPVVSPATSTFGPPPSHISPATKKTGRWNAMHVRIAWEIFYDQQKHNSEKASAAKLSSSDLLRPPGAGPPGSRMYPSLPRHSELGLLGSAGPSHRFESSYLSSHITPISGLSGLRYGAGSSGPPNAPAFHHPSVTPTSISGPPPGSMFSRDPIPVGLSLPTPTSHEAWRLRAPTPYGTSMNGSSLWNVKPDSSFYERERREKEERERKERERERERIEKEEKEKREREEQARRERERREREEKERERERERRAEHEKERLARLDAARRQEARSPLRHVPPEATMKSSSPAIGAHTPTHPSLIPPYLSSAPPSHHSKQVSDNSRPRSQSGSRPASRPDARPSKMDCKDDVMIVGSKEGNSSSAGGRPHPLPSHLSHFPSSSTASLFGGPPHAHSAAAAANFDRARLMSGAYGAPPPPPPPLGQPWPPDPFRDPYRVGLHDSLAAASAAHESMLAREAYRESLGGVDLRANPLGSLILNERYRDQQQQQQAREFIERERQYAAAVAAAVPPHPPHGLYPPSSHYAPVSLSSSLLPPTVKTGSSLSGHPHHAPHLHPAAGLSPLYSSVSLPTAAPGGLPPLGPPGLPPPLIPSLRGNSPSLQRPDKKDIPR